MEIYSHKNMLLKDHLLDVAKTSKSLVENKDLDLSIISNGELPNIAYLIGISHDFGKFTSYFQKKLNNENSKYSNHSLISAIFAYCLISKYTENKSIQIIAYLCVKHHHGNLKKPTADISKSKKELKKQIEDITKDKNRLNEIKSNYGELLKEYDININKVIDDLKNKIRNLDEFTEDIEDIENEFNRSDEIEHIERFLLCNFLFSVLIYSDKMEASQLKDDYFNNNLNEVNIDVKEYIDKNLKSSCNINKNQEINEIRDKFFNEVVDSRITPDKESKNIYLITAPTGIGKTLTTYGLANKLKSNSSNGKRIIYALPFTSIIDQNYEVIEKTLIHFLGEKYTNNPSRYLLKHHHLSNLIMGRKNKKVKKIDDNNYNENNETLNYLDQKLLLESWESANIITTFVQLFESIFSNRNSNIRKFHNIVNSIIIIDEMQVGPTEYYKLIGKVFGVLATKFKTTIIFLTATQPNLNMDCIELGNATKQSLEQNDIFDRVELRKLNNLKPMTTEDFVNEFTKIVKPDLPNDENCAIVVCNKIGNAIELYQKIAELEQYKDYKIYSLTTNLTPIDRMNKINEIKKCLENNEKIIVVSTQLIEAGVDISFKFGFRDLAPIDSIIQTSGRINRNNEYKNSKGKVYLFNHLIIDENNIERYGKSIYDKKAIQETEKILTEKEIFTEIDFIGMEDKYFNKYYKEGKSNKLLRGIKLLNYYDGKNDENNNKTLLPISSFKIIT